MSEKISLDSSETNVKIPFVFDIIGFGVLVKVCLV